jgi:hypothetical protein
MVFTTGAKGDARGACAVSFAPDLAKNHPDYGCGPRRQERKASVLGGEF